VAHSFVLQGFRTRRDPPNRPDGTIVEGVVFDITNDGKVCEFLAEGYVEEMSSRSIEKAVDDQLMGLTSEHPSSENTAAALEPEMADEESNESTAAATELEIDVPEGSDGSDDEDRVSKRRKLH
jgi:hypothetical protein